MIKSFWSLAVAATLCVALAWSSVAFADPPNKADAAAQRANELGLDADYVEVTDVQTINHGDWIEILTWYHITKSLADTASDPSSASGLALAKLEQLHKLGLDSLAQFSQLLASANNSTADQIIADCGLTIRQPKGLAAILDEYNSSKSIKYVEDLLNLPPALRNELFDLVGRLAERNAIGSGLAEAIDRAMPPDEKSSHKRRRPTSADYIAGVQGLLSQLRTACTQVDECAARGERPIAVHRFSSVEKLAGAANTSKGIPEELAQLRAPARQLLENEGRLLTEAEGLQSKLTGKFSTVVEGAKGDPSKTYLWTIDERGVNLGLEKTPFPTPRGNIVHTNLSPNACIGGEAWFTGPNEVTINAGSGRFGFGSGATESQWNAAVKFWESLGYKVNAVPFAQR